jgi:IclR family pca regulon transcriptional regulator
MENAAAATASSEIIAPISAEPLDPTERPDFVTALARGISVIRAFGPDAARMTLADIAKRVGLPRATVRRSLITLETLGYVESDGRVFTLTPKVLTLGHSYLSSSPFTRAAQPLLERFAATIHESSWVAILDETEALLVAGARTNRILSPGLTVGSRLPAAWSALGRALLSGLSDEELDAFLRRVKPRTYTARTMIDLSAIRKAVLDARANGYAIVDGEIEIGLSSIAVPVRDFNGRIVAAINASAPSERVRSTEMIERFLPLLQRTAEDLRPALV